MINAVLFDMDGLIFDTESVYKQSWQYAALEQGIEISEDFYQQFIGVQDAECEAMLSEHFQGRIDMPRYKRIRDTHFHNLREQGIALKPGFDVLFSEIKQRKLTTAIVTSSPLHDVKYNFSNHHYLEQFDLIITAEDVERGKPNPDCYQLAYKKLGYLADQCLVLEDSNNGIKAALAAGCHAVMVPDLLPPLEELKPHITVVSTLHEVIQHLDNDKNNDSD